jgi:hypothetical protein
MRRFFYLPPEVSWLLIIFSTYAFIQFPLVFQIPVILIASLILFIFRASNVPFQDTINNDGEIYLSPVFGTVESIRQNISSFDYESPCHEVRISVSFWDIKGLFLPTSGEVFYLRAMKGKTLHRNSPAHLFYGPVGEFSHTDFTLGSKNANTFLMRFIDCSTGKRPVIWLKSGDSGRSGACFGYYPFGGTLLIYLPARSDVLVFEKERVVPGQTVIAALKDKPKGH